MGLITGTTQHRLDVVKSYDPSNPFVVGINPSNGNGVTSVTVDVDNIQTVNYNIDGISYSTKLIKNINLVDKPTGVTTPNLNSPISTTRSYRPRVVNERSIQPDVHYPTTFSYTVSVTDETDYFIFKDEVKMGVVFTPKVYEEVFIERQSISVFEAQARLSEIRTLEDLVEYNNGFYNVTKTV